MANVVQRKLRQGFAATVLGVLAIGLAPKAGAFEIPTTPAGSWTGSGITTGTGWSGFALQTGTYSKSTPSGLTVTTGVDGAITAGAASGTSGAYFNSDAPTNTIWLNSGGPPPGPFTSIPTFPASANGITYNVETNPCVASAGAATTCSGLGTIRFQFTDPVGGVVPVVNPRFHITRIGGTIGGMELGSGLRINAGASSPGISFSSIAGAASATFTVTANEVYGNPSAPGTTLNVNCGVSATTTAGCGSVQVNGSLSTLQFDVRAYRTAVAPNSWAGGADAFVIGWTFDEDFGGAPTTYEGGGTAAAHLITDLRLGSGVSVENATTHNGTATGTSLITASPLAAAAGASPGDTQDALTSMPALNTSMIGSTYTVTPSISGASRGGDLCGWVDFDRSGTFSAAEGVCSAFAAGATSVPLNFTVPTATTAGATYARFRVTYDTNIGTANFNGLYSSGEVEDYQLQIMPAVRVVKALAPLPDSGTFNLLVNGTTFATAVGNAGTTNFRTVYHTGTPDVTVATNVANAAITGVTLSETAAGATVLANYATTAACVDGSGTAITPGGTATAPTVSIPQSLTGASANGRAQTITCTLTNTRQPTIAFVKALGSNRVANTDQFTMAIRTGGVSGSVVNSTTNSTTSGTGSTVTNGTTGTYVAAAGTAYTLTEGASGTTNFAQYTSAITCTDANGLQTGLPSGAAFTVATGLTITPVAGAAISCTLTNTGIYADLVVSKDNGGTTVVTGGTTTYTVRVTNNGPSAVTGAILSDPAATGLTKTSVACSGTPGQCGAAPSVAQIEGGAFALPALASGEFYEVTITANVTAPSGTVANVATATVPFGTTDPNTANNTAITDTDTVLFPALTISKSQTSGPDPVTASGQTIGYSIVVANTGSLPLTGVNLTDSLMQGATSLTLTSGPTLTTGDTNTNNIIDVGETWTYNASFLVKGAQIADAASITNTATVDTDQTNPASSTPVTTGITPGAVYTPTAPATACNASFAQWHILAPSGNPNSHDHGANWSTDMGFVQDGNGIPILTGTPDATGTVAYTGTTAPVIAELEAGVGPGEFLVIGYRVEGVPGASMSTIVRDPAGKREAVQYVIKNASGGVVLVEPSTGLAPVFSASQTDTTLNFTMPVEGYVNLFVYLSDFNQDFEAHMPFCNSAMTIDKRVAAATTTPLLAGQTVTFEYEVTNTGTVTINGVSVVENSFNGGSGVSELTPSGGLTTLLPGQSTVFTATYTLTQADVEFLQ